MNHEEYKLFKSELSELDILLSHIPKDLVIDRMSIEARKLQVMAELNASPVKETVRALLTFQGQPVVGTHGIFAEFGALAIGKFSSAVTAFAAGLRGPLGSRGPLPGLGDNKLLIIGSALGSFGFELEEYQPQNELSLTETSPVEQAIEQIRTVMQAMQNSEDDLADAISETDNRAIGALRDFFLTLVNNDATCAIDFKDKVVRLASVEQINKSVNLLSGKDIQEERAILGSFQGVLPGRRTFEFKIDNTEEIIIGKVHREIGDAAEINSILNTPVTIQCLVTQIGEGRPRYTLIGYNSLEK